MYKYSITYSINLSLVLLLVVLKGIIIQNFFAQSIVTTFFPDYLSAQGVKKNYTPSGKKKKKKVMLRKATKVHVYL